jgi:hypothetical protein
VSSRWRSVGFQGDDPAKDFRGGGVCSLKQLIYLATRYPKEYGTILAESGNYLFATSAINVTHMILIFFKLNPLEETIIPSAPLADNKSYKNFAYLAFLSNECYALLYCYCIRYLHKVWMDMSMDPNVTLM